MPLDEIDFSGRPAVPGHGLAPIPIAGAGWGIARLGAFARGIPIAGRTITNAGRRRVVAGHAFAEISRQGHALWWRARPASPRPCAVTNEEALDLSRRFLEQRGLYDRWARDARIDFTRTEVLDSEGDAFEEFVAAVHVNYTFRLDGLFAGGPGARMRTTIDDSGLVTEGFRLWREPAVAPEELPDTRRRPARPERARQTVADQLRRRFAQTTDHVRVRIETELIQYAAPPRVSQPMWLPAFAYFCEASAGARRFRFVTNVIAIDLDPREADAWVRPLGDGVEPLARTTST